MSEVHWITKEFIEKHVDLIEDCKFDEFYDIAKSNNPVLTISTLTDIFDDIGINTLSYLTIVPQGYLRSSSNSHKHVLIPKNVHAIEANAFSGTDLESLEFEEGCEIILNNAFSMCDNLTDVTLPRSLKKLSSRVFNACCNLDGIKFNGTIEEWLLIEKPRLWFTANPQYYRELQIVCLDGILSPFKEE